jgi:very-short-patch-repair endonuclease
MPVPPALRDTGRMPRRVPLPPHLKGASFRVSEQEFHELSRARMRSSDLDAPFHGIRSIGLHVDDVLGLARSYAPRLRAGQLFSHVTAARLWDIPLPLELSEASEVHVSSVGGTAPRARGVIGHELRIAERAAIEEIPLVPPAETWCQLGAYLSREDLVAAGDFLLSGKRLRRGGRTLPLCTRDDLTAAAVRFGRQPGAAGVRWALPKLRSGVDSRRESLLRLALVAHRLPEPVIAHPVAVEGDLVLHPDLAYPWVRLAIEYEGDEHREDKRRWRDDLRRIVLLEEAGWRVIRATDDDIQDPTVIVRAIRKALRG